jgi:hypothetical protein
MQNELTNMMAVLSNPQTRAEKIALIPEQLRELFTNPDKKLEIIGQDGMLALIAFENSILHGHPLSDKDQNTISALRDKLLALAVPQAE